MTMAIGMGMPDACAQAKRQADSAMLAAGDRSISPAMITMRQHQRDDGEFGREREAV